MAGHIEVFDLHRSSCLSSRSSAFPPPTTAITVTPQVQILSEGDHVTELCIIVDGEVEIVGQGGQRSQKHDSGTGDSKNGATTTDSSAVSLMASRK